MISNDALFMACHSGESRNPAPLLHFGSHWIPAFAGMTKIMSFLA